MLHMREDDEPDFEALAHVRALNQVTGKSNRLYLVNLEINGKPLTMEVDTGACMSLISEQTYLQVFPNRVLKPS